MAIKFALPALSKSGEKAGTTYTFLTLRLKSFVFMA